MEFGGELIIREVSRVWQEEKTELISFLAQCGGAELIVRMKLEDLDRFRTLPLEKEKREGSEEKNFQVFITTDDVLIEKASVAETWIFLTLADRLGKGSFDIGIDLNTAKQIKEKLDQFLSLQASLVAFEEIY